MAFYHPSKNAKNVPLSDAGGGARGDALTPEELWARKKRLREAAARRREERDAGAQPSQEGGANPKSVWPQGGAPSAAPPLPADARGFLAGVPSQVWQPEALPAVARPAAQADDFTYDDYRQAMLKTLAPLAADRRFSTFGAGREALDALDEYGYHTFWQAAEAREKRLANQDADLQARYDAQTQREAKILSDVNDGLLRGEPVDPQTNEKVAANLWAKANEYAAAIEILDEKNAVADELFQLQLKLYALQKGLSGFEFPAAPKKPKLVTEILSTRDELIRLNEQWSELLRLNPEYGENGENLAALWDTYRNAAEEASSNDNPVSYEENWEAAERMQELPAIREYKEHLQQQMDENAARMKEAEAQKENLKQQDIRRIALENTNLCHSVIEEYGEERIPEAIADLRNQYNREPDPVKQESIMASIRYLEDYSTTGSQQTSINQLSEMYAGHDALMGELAAAEERAAYWEEVLKLAEKGYALDEAEIAATNARFAQGFAQGEDAGDTDFVSRKFFEAHDQYNADLGRYSRRELTPEERERLIDEAEANLPLAESEVERIKGKLTAYDRAVAKAIEDVRLNAENGYTEMPRRADFAEKSKMVPGHDIYFQETIMTGIGPFQPVYDVINLPLSMTREGRYMTEEEKLIAYYIYNTQGHEATYTYIRSFLKSEINEREHDALIQYGQQLIEESSGPEAILYGSLASLVSGVSDFVAGYQTIMENLFEGDLYSEHYHGAGEYSESGNNSAYYDQVKSSSYDKVNQSYGPNAAFFFAAGMDILSEAPAALTGGAAPFVTSIAGFQEVYRNALDDGLDREQAVATAGAASMISAALGAIPLDELLSFPGEVSLTESFAAIAAQTVAEGASSGVERYAFYLYDYLANGDMSMYQRSLDKLTENGMPEGEAKNAVMQQIVYDVSMAMISDAFTGGLEAEIDMSFIDIPQ